LATIVIVRGSVKLGTWPLEGDDRPRLALIDELARRRVAARRVGYTIVVSDACPELAELLELVGLSDVLTGAAGPVLVVEVSRKAELGEEVGVEEVVQPGDPLA
jgi:hypothetical protein